MNTIILRPVGGHSVDYACQVAADVANLTGARVELHFNGALLDVRPGVTAARLLQVYWGNAGSERHG